MGKRRLPRVDVLRDHNDEWYWLLVAANGKTIGRSSEGYASKQHAIRQASRYLVKPFEMRVEQYDNAGQLQGFDLSTVRRKQ